MMSFRYKSSSQFQGYHLFVLGKGKNQRQGFSNLVEEHFGQDILLLGLLILLLDCGMLLYKLLS